MKIPLANIADVPLSRLEFSQALQTVESWITGECGAKQVAFCNVHVLSSTLWNPRLRKALRESDLVLPDGAPIAWLMRRMGCNNQRRIAGPDFMLQLTERLAMRSESIFLMGSTGENLQKLEQSLLKSFPSLSVAGSFSPPFRPLSDKENREITSMIHKSGTKTIWVGLGCPKQEIWIHENRQEVRGVFLGVGAAFDFLSGAKSRAPSWMQQAGLEWFFRLVSDPRRLLIRYLVSNTAFIWITFNELILRQLLCKFRGGRNASPFR